MKSRKMKPVLVETRPGQFYKRKGYSYNEVCKSLPEESAAAIQQIGPIVRCHGLFHVLGNGELLLEIQTTGAQLRWNDISKCWRR